MSGRILIVNDEQELLDELIPHLRKMGYEVHFLRNGKEAVETALKILPDIILLDTRLPGLRGFEVKSRLNENRLTASIPVIFLSSDFVDEARLEEFNISITDYISKPFEIKELINRVKDILNKKQNSSPMSIVDPQTGLHSYEFFLKQLAYYYDQTKRYSNTFSIIVIEINNLELITEVNGEAIRDSVLEEFSSIASRCMRSSDILSHCEANIFTILLPETDLNGALPVIDKLKQVVSESVVRIPGFNEKIYFSVSAGAAEADNSCKKGTDIYHNAINRMNEDKVKTRYSS